MFIYPYVYRLDHPVTGEFYIGYRSANKFPAEQDLGHEYFTSSKVVKPRFNEFKIQIIAEFFESVDAYDFEQKLILEYWGNHKLINKMIRHNGKNRWSFHGRKHSEETKNKMRNRKISDETREKSRKRRHSEETKDKIRSTLLGIKHVRSKEHCSRIKEAAKYRKPISDETREKMSFRSKTNPPFLRCCRVSDRKEMSTCSLFRHT